MGDLKWIVEKEDDWALHHRARTRPAQQLSCDIGQELQVSMRVWGWAMRHVAPASKRKSPTKLQSPSTRCVLVHRHRLRLRPLNRHRHRRLLHLRRRPPSPRRQYLSEPGRHAAGRVVHAACWEHVHRSLLRKRTHLRNPPQTRAFHTVPIQCRSCEIPLTS